MKKMVTLALYLVTLKVLDFIDNLKKDYSDER
jgi:hypothetical protein